MLVDVPVLESPCRSPSATRATISIPTSFQGESILALFELAARQTHDPDLVHHIRQVIAAKRRAPGYAQLPSPIILDTHADFDQEKIWGVPIKYLLRPGIRLVEGFSDSQTSRAKPFELLFSLGTRFHHRS